MPARGYRKRKDRPRKRAGRAKADPADALASLLSRVMTPEAARTWMRAPNPAFAGRVPLEMWARGEDGPIRAMVEELESGIPG